MNASRWVTLGRRATPLPGLLDAAIQRVLVLAIARAQLAASTLEVRVQRVSVVPISSGLALVQRIERRARGTAEPWRDALAEGWRGGEL